MKKKRKAVIISLEGLERLKLTKNVLSSEYNVNLLVSDFSHSRKETIKSYDKDCDYIHVLTYKKNLSIRRMISYIDFGRKVYQFLKKEKPDFVYLMLPPNNVAWYCYKYISKVKKAKYFVEVYDLWPESFPIETRNSILKIIFYFWKKMRVNSLIKADHVFLECNLYAKSLGKYIKKSKTSILYLEKTISKSNKSLISEKLLQYRQSEKVITFAYLGSINYIINTDGICEFIRKVKKSNFEVKVKIIGDGEGKDNFIDKLKSNGAKVDFYGIIYDERKKINILASCDFAFNMMIKNVKVGLTTKSIDYLSMGLPLINSIKGDTWKIVDDYGVGVNYNGDIELFLKVIEEKSVFKLKKNSIKCFNSLFSSDVFKKNLKNVMIENNVV